MESAEGGHFPKKKIHNLIQHNVRTTKWEANFLKSQLMGCVSVNLQKSTKQWSGPEGHAAIEEDVALPDLHEAPQRRHAPQRLRLMGTTKKGGGKSRKD